MDTKLTALQKSTVQVQACSAAEAVSAYVPGPVSVGPEIYAGALAGVIPFAIGSWEFGKRIVRGLMLTPSKSYSCSSCLRQFYKECCEVLHFPGWAADSLVVVWQIIQRRCAECSGSGLVQKGRFNHKCPECGGFFPWQGWRRFFTSAATPGNGGPLRQPRGQTSVFYR